MADSRGAGAGLLRRRQLRLRRGADAPGAGVRQGVRRRHRPARAGAAAHRGRPDERGRAVRRARPAPAGRRSPRRRSSPATCCSPSTSARGCTSATCRPPARSRSSAGPRRKGCDVTAEVTPHHLLLTDELAATLRPGLQGQPAAAHRRRRRGAARGPGRRHDRRRRHRPRAAPAEDKECEWAAAALGMLGLETALSVVQQAMVDTGLLDWAGVADRMSARPARIGRLADHGRPLEVGAPANLMLVDPAATLRSSTRRDSASQSRNTPVRRARRCPARVVATFLRGTPDRPRREAAVTADSAPRPAAMLVLEDGRTFRGEAYGAIGETFGEAVFTTGMTGYQETLTDPSYHRQVVVMTAPHIGNTGVNDEDPESRRIWVAGYVVRDPARVPRQLAGAAARLDDELAAQGVVGISGIDTRALTRHLRERGAMRVGDLARRTTDAGALLERVLAAPAMAGADLAGEVTTAEPYVVPAVGRAAVHRRRARPRHQGDDAAPAGRARHRGARAAGDVDARRRARGRRRRGVLLQRPRRPGHRRPRGRADPRRCSTRGSRCSASASATRSSAGRSASAPTSCGYGHRGINQPVLDRTTGKVEVTAHNHGFAVDAPLDGHVRHAVRRAPRSATSASTTTSSRGCAASTCRRSRCSTTRRPRPARTTRLPLRPVRRPDARAREGAR